MAKYQLTAKTREDKGKGAARKLRREGYVPAVLYGEASENRLLAIEARSLGALFRSVGMGSHLVDLEVEGDSSARKNLALLKDIQQHPSRGDLLHVDLQLVSLKKKIHLTVPVVLTGEPVGVKTSGGVLELLSRELEIECLPDKIPDQIAVDVSALDVGDSLHVSDVSVQDVVILNSGETPVATVARPTVIEEPVVEEEAEELAEGEEAPAEAEGEAPPADEQATEPKE
jgi:large subunit ribosomal protein L25